MPRRIPDYPDAFAGWNLVSSVGSLISVISTVLFGYIIYDILSNDARVEEDAFALPYYFMDTPEHWMQIHQANSLEFSLHSPTPLHAYHTLPVQS